MFGKFFGLFSNDFGIDLGTADRLVQTRKSKPFQKVDDARTLLPPNAGLEGVTVKSEYFEVRGRLRLDLRAFDFQTVLDTQRIQFSAQDAVVSASADLGNDHINLFKALGGGWREAPRLARNGPTP